MVYRGLDIGTAKPSEAERKQYRYAGLDLVDPDDDFSTGAFIERVSMELDEEPAIAVGGTGLYFRALMEGLSANDAPNPVRRRELEAMSASALRDLLREKDPGVLSSLRDPENPRRLIRAIEALESGTHGTRKWQDLAPHPVVVVQRDREELNERIATRVQQMFEAGLIEETKRLQETFPSWQGTARQAIGYAEADTVLAGTMSIEQAMNKISARTRQYAKRQRTWFRNQWESLWVDLSQQTQKQAADEILQHWTRSGPVWLDLSV